MASSTLSRITNKAKQLYKKGKAGITWMQAIQKSSRMLKGGSAKSKKGKTRKVGAVKILQKGETKKSPVTKTLMQTRGKSGTFKGYKQIGTISGHISAAKKLLFEKICRAEGRKMLATTKTEKRKVGKELLQLSRQYKKL